jgi:hypothetical protein
MAGSILHRWHEEDQDDQAYVAAPTFTTSLHFQQMISTTIAAANGTTASVVTCTAGVVVDREPIKPKLVGKGKCFVWRCTSLPVCAV